METSKITQLIQNAKSLDFGTLFNDSIDLFKKVWVQGLVTVIINMALAIPLVMIIYIPLIFLGLFDAMGNSYDPYGYDSYSSSEPSVMALGIMFVIYILVVLAMSILAIGLRAAFYRICKLKDFNEVGKEDYFFFFKKPYLSKTINLGLAYAGISLLAAMLCVLPIFYVVVPLTYMIVIYAFNPDKSVSEIINLSFSLGNKKWLLTFGLMIVCGFLAGIVGMLMCFVGVYVTQSFAWLQPYLIYKDVVGFEDEDEIKQISGQL